MNNKKLIISIHLISLKKIFSGNRTARTSKAKQIQADPNIDERIEKVKKKSTGFGSVLFSEI